MPCSLIPKLSPFHQERQNSHNMITRLKATSFTTKALLSIHNITIQQTVKQALAHKGYLVMKDEYDAPIRNNTWEFVPYPANIKIIDKKWLFKIKVRANNSLYIIKVNI